MRSCGFLKIKKIFSFSKTHNYATTHPWREEKMNLIGTLPQPPTHTQPLGDLFTVPWHVYAVFLVFVCSAAVGQTSCSNLVFKSANSSEVKAPESLHNRYMYCISEIHVMYAFHPPGPPDLTPCTHPPPFPTNQRLGA